MRAIWAKEKISFHKFAFFAGGKKKYLVMNALANSSQVVIVFHFLNLLVFDYQRKM